MAGPVYPNDLINAEWTVPAPQTPPAKLRGRPRLVDLRRIIDGIFYLLRSGCTWRWPPGSALSESTS